MTQKIIVIGDIGASKAALALEAIKKEHGNNIVFVTPEEARQEALERAKNAPSKRLAAIGASTMLGGGFGFDAPEPNVNLWTGVILEQSKRKPKKPKQFQKKKKMKNPNQYKRT